jgi:hypothetical protein
MPAAVRTYFTTLTGIVVVAPPWLMTSGTLKPAGNFDTIFALIW